MADAQVQNAGYGNLGGKIAFLWMAFSVVSGVFVYFFLPELKGRSLEELDYMFEARIGTRNFKTFDSSAILAQKRTQHHSNVEDVKEDISKMEA